MRDPILEAYRRAGIAVTETPAVPVEKPIDPPSAGDLKPLSESELTAIMLQKAGIQK